MTVNVPARRGDTVHIDASDVPRAEPATAMTYEELAAFGLTALDDALDSE